MEERLAFLSEGTTPRKNLEVMQEAIKEAGGICGVLSFVRAGVASDKVTKLRKKKAKKVPGITCLLLAAWASSSLPAL